MTTRKIKIYTTTGMPGTIETNAATLSELKPLLRQRDINFDGMKMLVGETKNELSVDEATLPEGDFKLYLMPAKTKSGVDFDNMEQQVESVYQDMEDVTEKLDEANEVVARLEEKVDKLLDILENSASFANATSAGQLYNAVAKVPTISAEDQREMEELRRLAGLTGSSEEWED